MTQGDAKARRQRRDWLLRVCSQAQQHQEAGRKRCLPLPGAPWPAPPVDAELAPALEEDAAPGEPLVPACGTLPDDS